MSGSNESLSRACPERSEMVAKQTDQFNGDQWTFDSGEFIRDTNILLQDARFQQAESGILSLRRRYEVFRLTPSKNDIFRDLYAYLFQR